MTSTDVNSPAVSFENKIKYYCCCEFRNSLSNSDKHDKDQPNSMNNDITDNLNNQDTVVVQEPPVTQQPMTSQALHVPGTSSSDPENNASVSQDPSQDNLENMFSSQNGQATQNDFQSNKYKSVKEYMKVENFMNEF